MFCKKCGSEIVGDVKFCPNCGANRDGKLFPEAEQINIPPVNQTSTSSKGGECMLRKKVLALALCLGVFASQVGVGLAQTTVIINNGPALTKTTQSTAAANWGKDGYVEAIGIGLSHGVGRNALAKRAAVVDAYRNLAEATQGVQVDAETTVEQLIVVNDTIKTQVSALIRGAKVVEEGLNSDGSYYVRMRMPLYGDQGLASAVMPKIVAQTPEPFPAANTTNTANNVEVSGNYTGVVIDARGLGLVPTFAPAIFDDAGRAVYGVKNIDADYAINNGTVDYLKDSTSWQSGTRAGSNPLVIKAHKAKLSSNGVTKVSAIISSIDADLMLRENAKSRFLNKCAVVFAI